MALYYESLGNDKYKLIYADGSRANRFRRMRTVQVTGTKTQVERALQRELLDFADEVDEELTSGLEFAFDKKTFKSLANKWIELKETNITSRTIEGYTAILDNRLIPKLGKLKIENISPLIIQNLYSEMLKEKTKYNGKMKTLSPNTVKKHHAVLKAMFNDAYKLGMISINVMDRVTPPKEIPHKADYYTKEDIDTMLPYLMKESLQFISIVLLTATTGARRGEIAALRWNDVDFKKQTIIIRRAVTLVKGERVLKKPKTTSRLIQLPDMVVELLRQLLLEEKEKKMLLGIDWQGINGINGKVEDNYIFTNQFGFWYYPDSYNNMWLKFLERNKLKVITFHELRHTAASILIFGGLDIKSIQKILGHTKSATTLDVYGHIFQSADEEAASLMTEMYSPTLENVPPNVPPRAEKQ